MKIIYNYKYNINLGWMARIHPFDSAKYGKAWGCLHEKHTKVLDRCHIEVEQPCHKDDLLLAHSDVYLNKVKDPEYLMGILEVPKIIGRIAPASVVEKIILKPMLFAVQGTIIAIHQALESGCAINMSGGYHHASYDSGEGFCVYSDIAIAIKNIRKSGKVSDEDSILIIDLDAHQGNGFERIFFDDKKIKIFDMYNAQIYPNDLYARRRIDCDIQLPSGTASNDYLSILKSQLPNFIDKYASAKIAIFNAGTDIYEKDRLGRLAVSAEAIRERDIFVMEALSKAGIPWVMLPSGGYTKESYILMANSIEYAMKKWG